MKFIYIKSQATYDSKRQRMRGRDTISDSDQLVIPNHSNLNVHT